MHVPSEMRKCVAFIGCQRNSGRAVFGTVFFVAYPIEGTDRAAMYAVTAMHVIEAIKQRASDHMSLLRLNVVGGPPAFAQLAIDSWIANEDGRVDVAVAPIPLDFTKCDHKLFTVDGFLTDEVIAKHEIGVGEELFFPGLFTRHIGENSNIPIVRIGNIAAMPEERINVTGRGKLRAYLAEARSIGGLSGSPAFVSTTGMRTQGGKNVFLTGGQAFYLLGLVHGHFGVREQLDAVDHVFDQQDQSRSINMGIAIIVPADDIRATLDHPLLVAQRENIRASVMAQDKETEQTAVASVDKTQQNADQD